MSALRIGLCASANETAAFRLALEHLTGVPSDSHPAAGALWTIDNLATDGAATSPQNFDVAVVSMSHWMAGHWIDDARQRDEQIGAFVANLASRSATLCLCTMLRHPGSDDAAPTLSRIRKLNLLTIQLSQKLGVTVFDLDRQLAGLGAATFATDWQLSGDFGIEAAARQFAEVLVTTGVAAKLPQFEGRRAREILDNWQPPVAIKIMTRAAQHKMGNAVMAKRGYRRVLHLIAGGYLSWPMIADFAADALSRALGRRHHW